MQLRSSTKPCRASATRILSTTKATSSNSRVWKASSSGTCPALARISIFWINYSFTKRCYGSKMAKPMASVSPTTPFGKLFDIDRTTPVIDGSHDGTVPALHRQCSHLQFLLRRHHPRFLDCHRVFHHRLLHRYRHRWHQSHCTVP